MKTNELRIGNWVEWEDDSHEQVQVLSLSYIMDSERKEITNYFINGGLIDDFLPIPLTEEWLLKFGFTKEDKAELWVHKQELKLREGKDKKEYTQIKKELQLIEERVQKMEEYLQDSLVTDHP